MKANCINILFLGAGKRLSLLEQFVTAARLESAQMRLFAIEKTIAVPICTVAEVLVGPAFRDPAFGKYLCSIVDHHKIGIVIPNMDSATVALSACNGDLAALGCWAVVSDRALCETMEDKLLADKWFTGYALPVPRGEGFPRIAKHRLGFGSRDQFVAGTQAELDGFLNHRRAEDYIVQPFIQGQEYTVDAYVDKRGRILGVFTRKRLEVSAGEVDVSESHRHAGIIELTKKALAFPGWQGPITLQFIDSACGPVLVEINPRFGGGTTHAIHCGLEMPRWILREHLGREVSPVAEWREGSIMTRCRRDVFL